MTNQAERQLILVVNINTSSEWNSATRERFQKSTADCDGDECSRCTYVDCVADADSKSSDHIIHTTQRAAEPTALDVPQAKLSRGERSQMEVRSMIVA